MSERGRITGRMYNSDGSLNLTMILGDGQPQDGQVIPPGFMLEVASKWLDGDPQLMGADGKVGYGYRVWQDHDKTMLEALVTDSETARLLAMGASSRFGLGFADPSFRRDDDAPNGVMTGGTLVYVIVSPAADTCLRCGKQEPSSLAELYRHRAGDFSDVRAQLPVLYAWAHQPRVRIIELGVRNGYSTCALLAGIERAGTGGELWSVDITHPKVPDWFHKVPFWHQLTASSLSDEALAFCPDGADIVFNDASHYYDQTLAELQAYVPKIRPGGVYLLHDTDTMSGGTPGGSKCPDVAPAIDAFCKLSGLSWYQHPGWNGLGVIEIPLG